MRKIAIFTSALTAALFICVIILGADCNNNPNNPEQAGGNGTTPPDTSVINPPDTSVIIPLDTSVITPPDTSVIIPPDTSVINPPDTSVITPPDTSVITPPDTSVITPPDTSVITPPDTSVITPPDTSVITPPDTSVITPPDTSVITPPDTSVITPPDTSVITPPDTSVVTPPDTAAPPLSPRDSILNHIDKKWKDYGYTSKPTKYVALTFDDGPCAQTGNLLAALANKKVRATFFLIGQNVRGNQAQAKAVHDAGHELANHSDGYSGLGGNTAANTISESLTAASTAIRNITGKSVSLFRAPNVEYGGNLTAVCKQQGLAVIGVSIWSQDYQSGISSAAIAGNVTNNPSDGGIINCHEANTAPNTIAAIPAMIDGLRAKGFWVCTVGELAAIKGKILQAGTQYDKIQ